MRKFLFVGLGGSGGKTLRFLRNDLQQWLNQIGYNDFPTGWQMLHIDTPTVQDGQEIREVPMLPPSSYVGLVAPGINFETVTRSLDGAGPNAKKDLASWRVDPTYLSVPISVGAGQFRAVGRAIGLAHTQAITRAIATASSRLQSARTDAELSEIHQLAFGSSQQVSGEPVVVVISSLAGGTGAGLLLDTCDILRQYGSWGGNSFGILYASDVFNEIGSLGAAGVQPNSLAALSELMNGYWLNSNKPRTNAFFAAGNAPIPVDRSGPAYPFLVGASNTRGISFGNQKSIYGMMGRALKSWTVDPVIQDQLVAYTIANWQTLGDGNVVRSGTLSVGLMPIFEAFGYAEVGLGTDRFARYSAERLAKSAAEWLYEAHFMISRSLDPNDARTSSEIEESMARENLFTVLRTLNLDERGEANQIIDSLLPDDWESSFRSAVDTAFALATAGVSQLDANGWTNRISEVIPSAAPEYEKGYDIGVRDQVGRWVDLVPTQTIEIVNELIQRYGLRVAARTVDLLVEELRQVANELENEITDFKRISQPQDVRGAIRAELPNAGNYTVNNPQVTQAVEMGMWTQAGYECEALRRRVARQLMMEFASGFLEPLARQIRNAFQELHHKGFLGEGNEPPTVDSWSGEVVPDSLKPPKNEFLILGIDEFAPTFEVLVSRSTRAEHRRDQLSEARKAVIDGQFLKEDSTDDEVALPIVVTQSWAPSRNLLLGAITDQAKAAFDLRYEPEALLERADLWIRRPGSMFAEFLNSDLPGFLGDDDRVSVAETNKRRTDFIAAFRSALGAAEPLVKINEQLRTEIHSRNRALRAVPSTLPFAGHPLEKQVREILHSALGVEAGDSASREITSTKGIRSISISSTLGAPHDPLVFDSITAPMVAAWAQAGVAPAAQISFWKNRRSRPIQEFVPVSQEMLVCLTRGWFTGLLLGLIDWDTRRIAAQPRPVQFPERLLTNPTNQRDRLPALLESIGLAYCEVAQNLSLKPLEPYLALRDFGLAPVSQAMQHADIYGEPNAAIEIWVKTGTVADGLIEGLAPKTISELFGDEASPTDRQNVLIQKLEDTLASYENAYQVYLDSAEHHPAHLGSSYGLWPGMYDVITSALGDLLVAINNMKMSSDAEM